MSSLALSPPAYLLLVPVFSILLVIHLKHRRSQRSFLASELTSPSPTSACEVLVASLAQRRSIYGFAAGGALPPHITRQKIQEVVKQLVKYSPSSYNAESSRVVVLWRDESKKLWAEVWEGIERSANFPTEDARRASKSKISALAEGAGTLLFFEDSDIVAQIGNPSHFEQSSGMLQINVWTALSTMEVGASLHHYSNLMTDSVHAKYDLPRSWVLKGEMPFGAIGVPAEPKKKTWEGRVRVFGGGEKEEEGVREKGVWVV